MPSFSAYVPKRRFRTWKFTFVVTDESTPASLREPSNGGAFGAGICVGVAAGADGRCADWVDDGAQGRREIGRPDGAGGAAVQPESLLGAAVRSVRSAATGP